MKRKLAYLSGPISLGDQKANVEKAMKLARELYDMGLDVFVPHLSWYLQWNDLSLDDWLRLDFRIIENCDVLYRMPGESVGADKEVDFAVARSIPVFESLSSLRVWLDRFKNVVSDNVVSSANEPETAVRGCCAVKQTDMEEARRRLMPGYNGGGMREALEEVSKSKSCDDGRWKPCVNGKAEEKSGTISVNGEAFYEVGKPFLEILGGNVHPTSMKFYKKLVEFAALHAKKQKDYGRAGDPFANVRAAADFGLKPELGVFLRMNDKMKRIQSFAQKGTLENESVADSLADLAVYSAIALVLMEEGRDAELDAKEYACWKDLSTDAPCESGKEGVVEDISEDVTELAGATC